MKRLPRHLATIVFALVLLTVAAASASAQEYGRPGKFGLSAAVQAEQLDLLIPIWAGEKLVIVPAVSVQHVSDAATDFGFGLGLRYMFKEGKARPYLGFRAGILMLSPDVGDSRTDFILGPSLGGEYFLDEHFSFGVEAQVNMAISDKGSYRFGNPDGTNINTATTAMVTFYF